MGCGAVYCGVDLSYFQNILDALLRAGARLEQAVATLVNYLITPGPTVLTYQPMGPSLPISVGEAVPVADTVSGTDVAGGTACTRVWPSRSPGRCWTSADPCGHLVL